MITELLYQIDSYIKEFEAEVIHVEGNKVVLNKTAFHPRSGGVANDTGFLINDNKRFRVVNVTIDKVNQVIIHHLESESHNIRKGSIVKGIIDWSRRYMLMRLHTAAHIIAAIMYRDYNAVITGGNVYPEYAYDDYSLEIFDRKIFEDVIMKANDIVKRNLEIKIYWLEREKALKIPGIVKLESRMPPEIRTLRIVEIPDVDIQADGGPHVRNTKEIGEIVLLKVQNKGKKRKRMYYTVR